MGTQASPRVKLNIIDRAMAVISPGRAIERIRARAALSYLGGAGYITSGSNRRSMRGWLSGSGTADQDTLPKAGRSRQDCRDLYMNSPMATAALRRVRTNVVGHGLRLQSRIDREALGISDDSADAWERKTEREFALWAESKDCDAARTLNFMGLQRLAFLATIMSGDAFALLPFIVRKGTPYDLRVQIIEADFVNNPNMAMDTNRTAGGIEVDEHGAPVKYWFQIPDLNQMLNVGTIGMRVGSKWTGIDAFGAKSGRRNVLHLYDKERPGQRRGMPMLAPVVETLKQLSRLSEAELMASVINAFFTVFVKTNPLAGGMQQGLVPEERVADPDRTGNPADENVYEMGHGNIIELGENQAIELADPKRPSEGFEPFFLGMLKQIGSAVEVPFELLILHFSSSYSASRAALLEAWKFFRSRRHWLSSDFCQPIYVEWLTEAIHKNRVSAPGFLRSPTLRKAWSGSAWSGTGQGQIDPFRETRAAALRVQNIMSTFEDEHNAISISGDDWEGTLNRNARERKAIKEKGIELPAAAPAGGGR